MAEQLSPYPLTFEPIYKEKVWGGRALEKLGRALPGDESTLIGESWELADLAATAASGGGGGAERSVIVNGPLAGRTLHEAIERHREAMLGELPLNEQGAFPLLVKFLDAQQNLSVQVHPSEQYAAKHPEAHLKSEAWYIVDCEPGAVIYKGVQEGVTPEQFRRALEADQLEPLLLKVPVEPGQCHYLPSGTCHALGAGVVVAEVQTPSDTTFRVYDWGRTGRQLHVEEAMQCIHFGPPATEQYELNAKVQGAHTEALRLVHTEYFHIDRYAASAGFSDEIAAGEPRIWMVLSGSGKITGDAPALEFGPLQTIFLPAAMTGQVQLSEPATWLEVTFPQARSPRLS
jgi:mannose-6-phosphate isomerase